MIRSLARIRSTLLGRRLLFWVLLISGINAVFAISFQLYTGYRQDLADIDDTQVFIRSSELPGLAQAAWNFDRDQLMAQLSGIVKSPWVAGVRLRYGPNETASLEAGRLTGGALPLWEIPLVHGSAGATVQVGRLYVQPSQDELLRRTRERVRVVLATQLAKVLVLTVCLLWLFSFMVTRHLHRMAEFAGRFIPGEAFQPLALKRAEPRQSDELTLLRDSLNAAYARLNIALAAQHRHVEELELRVAERTEALRAANEQLAASAQAMRELAHHDPLTGLANRMLLDERLSGALARAQRHRREVVVLLIDLDRFKPVNDRFGHAAGDALLQSLAQRMRAFLRETDTLARIGGDEFVLVLEDLGAGVQVDRIVTQVAAAIGEPWLWQGEPAGVQASIGSARYPEDGATGQELLRVADARMYAAKSRREHR